MKMVFTEIDKIIKSEIIEPPLAKLAEVKDLNKKMEDYDQPLTRLNEYMKNTPLTNGIWGGERGNSDWFPDKNYIPLKENPEGKTWGEVLEEYGIESIAFKDGEPDLSEISKGEVKIDNFTDKRSDNFYQAYEKLAEEKGCSPREVKDWMKDNGYTWHESKDMETMLKVPSIVHNNIPHAGGISEYKKGVEEA